MKKLIPLIFAGIVIIVLVHKLNVASHERDIAIQERDRATHEIVVTALERDRTAIALTVFSRLSETPVSVTYSNTGIVYLSLTNRLGQKTNLTIPSR